MRHRKAGRKFGRQSAPRRALMRGLVTNLVRYERIRTTDAKAKELRREAERTISWSASVAELVQREPETLADHERARVVHAMRMARRTLRDKEVLHKLFHDVAPRYLGRAGGYTRIIKIGNRLGDAAPMSYIELMPGEEEAGGKEAAEEAPKGKKGKGKPATTEAQPEGKGRGRAKAAAAAKAAKEPAKPKRGAARAEAKQEKGKPKGRKTKSEE